MSLLAARRTRAPRLVVRILGFSFAVITVLLAAVFLLLSWQTRERLTRAIVDSMEASQTRFADLEARRQRERGLQAATLAENPTLKAAVDTYYAERSNPESVEELVGTIRRELAKLQETMEVPALSVTEATSIILASTGPAAGDWTPGDTVPLRAGVDRAPVETVLTRRSPATGASTPYLATVVPLALGPDVVGDVILAAPMDDGYARELATEARADVAVFIDGRLVASSLAAGARAVLATLALPERGTVAVDGDEMVVRRLMSVDAADVYALGSITAPVRAATAEAGRVLLIVGACALLFAGISSWWLARTLARPIDELRRTLAQMADARDFERPLPAMGQSFELDALAETFDALRAAVAAAEAESESTYLGVISALAAALDARDPYTAGHSQRVAELSLAIGRELGLDEREREILRLGALLHDIGKIGVSDAVLRKPGTLTDEEYEQIKRHPALGARILKPLHFLAEHLAIVELHHEQPDGRGYPFGLVGDEIPLFARIVHVADAFDAMTSARAYRPGRPATDAMAELWRCAGTGFDLRVVQVMASMPTELLTRPTPGAREGESTAVGGALVPFRLRAAGGGRRSVS